MPEDKPTTPPASQHTVYPDDIRWDRMPPPPGVRESAGASPRGHQFESARAQTNRALKTAIRADLGESRAYQEALRRREVGIERPQGSNVKGRPDFITARELRSGNVEIVVTDVKTSERGRFPRPNSRMPRGWQDRVRDAIGPDRLKLGDPVLEQKIRDAFATGRVRLRQVNVDYSPAGQGRITGLDGGPVPRVGSGIPRPTTPTVTTGAGLTAPKPGARIANPVPEPLPRLKTTIGRVAGGLGAIGIGVAAGLLEGWVRNKVIEDQIEHGFKDLGPKVEARIDGLATQAAAMRAEAPDKPLYAHVTVEVKVLNVLQESGPASWDHAPSAAFVELKGVTLSREPLANPQQASSREVHIGHFYDNHDVTYSLPVEVGERSEPLAAQRPPPNGPQPTTAPASNAPPPSAQQAGPPPKELPPAARPLVPPRSATAQKDVPITPGR